MLTHVNEEQRTLKPNIETQKAKYEQLNVTDCLSSNPRALLSYYHPNRKYINPLMPETFFPSFLQICVMQIYNTAKATKARASTEHRCKNAMK